MTRCIGVALNKRVGGRKPEPDLTFLLLRLVDSRGRKNGAIWKSAVPCIQSFLVSSFGAHFLGLTSRNRKVPINTRTVPAWCIGVNGFPKYTMDRAREKNFRNVMTSVTVKDVNSVVSKYTAEMQTYLGRANLELKIISRREESAYCVRTLAASRTHSTGASNCSRTGTSWITRRGESLKISQCS